MSLGKIRTFILILILFNSNYAHTEDQIVTSPLINLEELELSFEEVETLDSNDVTKSKLKEKKGKSLNQSISVVKVMGLDKITAKTSLINIKIGETKKYGVLEIKALKCGKIERNNSIDHAAYIQVKDISQNQSEQVLFSTVGHFYLIRQLPIDHAIYDLWLVGLKQFSKPFHLQPICVSKLEFVNFSCF